MKKENTMKNSLLFLWKFLKHKAFWVKGVYDDALDHWILCSTQNSIEALNEMLKWEKDPCGRRQIIVELEMQSVAYNNAARRIEEREDHHAVVH
jgi:hypothetical protein